MNNFLPPEAKKVLVLSPHPDDESIGCAGTTMLYSENGTEVYLVVISDGEKLETAKDINNIVEIRRSETIRAANILGIKETIFLGFPDERLDEHKVNIREEIIKIIKDINPEILYAPFPLDPHPDHRVVSEIVLSINRDFKGFKIAFYEIYNAIRFNVLVDISSVLDKKREAILSYKNSLLGIPELFWYSIKGLSAYRSLAIKKEGFYEAFWLIDGPFTDDDVIDWATFSKAESAAKIFISKLRQTDELINEMQKAYSLLTNMEGEILNLKKLIYDKDEEITNLKKENHKLKADLSYILDSLFWKFITKFYNIRDKLLPEETNRRDFYNKIVKRFKKSKSL